MKTKITFLLAVLTVLSLASAEAQFTTNTLTFSGASWNDGGSLDGYFTIQYDLAGTPVDLLSLDVTTGDGTADGFLGYTYLYNVEGENDTVSPGWINFIDETPTFISATQNDGAPANEICLQAQDDASRRLFLDWQSSDPTALYLGNVEGQYSSEDYSGSPGIRGLNSDGGSVGTVPEPSFIALTGLGFLALGLVARRRNART